MGRRGSLFVMGLIYVCLVLSSQKLRAGALQARKEETSPFLHYFLFNLDDVGYMNIYFSTHIHQLKISILSNLKTLALMLFTCSKEKYLTFLLL